jgi:hypothetical protein
MRDDERQFAPAATPKVGFYLPENDPAGGGQRQKWGMKTRCGGWA